MVRVHVRAPDLGPCASSSYRASFVNSYSSVRVRPGAPFQDCGVMSSISPCEGDGPGANPGFLTDFRWAEVDRLSSTKEGVPSVVKALAVRVRFPAWSASVRSRHLSICSPRSSTARERPDFIPGPIAFHFSTGRRIGLSLKTTWSPVRVRPPAQAAGVAQW